MSMSKTTNLSLSQYVGADSVTVADFNDSFDKIDKAFDKTTGHNHSGIAGQGPKIDAKNIAFLQAGFTSQNLKDALNELFTDANSVINTLSAAIGYQGVPNSTYIQCKDRIIAIKQLLIDAIDSRSKDIPDNSSLLDIKNTISVANWPLRAYGTAKISDVLENKTFKNNDSDIDILTGNIPKKETTIISKTGKEEYLISEGLYPIGSIFKKEPNLISNNIVEGKNIYDVIGSFKNNPGYDINDIIPKEKIITKKTMTKTWQIESKTSYEATLFVCSVNNNVVIIHNRLSDSAPIIEIFNSSGVKVWEKLIHRNGRTDDLWFHCFLQNENELYITVNNYVSSNVVSGNLLYGCNLTTFSDIIVDFVAEYSEAIVSSKYVYSFFDKYFSIQDKTSGAYLLSGRIDSRIGTSKCIYNKKTDSVLFLAIENNGVVLKSFTNDLSVPHIVYFITSNISQVDCNICVDKDGYVYIFNGIDYSITKIYVYNDTSWDMLSQFYFANKCNYVTYPTSPFVPPHCEITNMIISNNHLCLRDISHYTNYPRGFLAYHVYDTDFNPLWFYAGGDLIIDQNDLSVVNAFDSEGNFYVKDSNYIAKFNSSTDKYYLI